MTEDLKFMGVSVVEGEEPTMLVGVKSGIEGETKEVSISKKEFANYFVNNEIEKNKGDCPSLAELSKSYSEMINKVAMEGNLKMRRYHKSLGWNNCEDKFVFYGDSTVSAGMGVKSSYCGGIDVEQVGSVENISNMIKTEILGLGRWSPLEAVIAFGVGATVLPYANEVWDNSLDNIMVHLFSGSVTGKTTALSLAVGLGSNPCSGKGYLMSGYYKDAMQSIGNNNGYPVAVDDLLCRSEKGCKNMIYGIAKGNWKKSYSSKGKDLQETTSFQTVVLTSGEEPVLGMYSKDGLRARCLQLEDICWTSSGKQADEIKKCMKRNYGLVTPLVAEELINNDANWKARFEYWKKAVSKQMEKDEVRLAVSRRMVDYVAVFALSTEVANTVLDVELDVEKVFKFCYEHMVMENEERSLLTGAYSSFM